MPYHFIAMPKWFLLKFSNEGGGDMMDAYFIIIIV